MGGTEGMRSDPEDGRRVGEFRDGKRDAVDAKRTLVDTEFMDGRREGDREAMVLSVRREIDDCASGIDVALHEMAAEAVAHGQGTFQVNEAVGSELAQRSHLECLGEEIKAYVLFQFRDGEATSVDRHRITEGEFGGKGDGESESGLLAFFFKRYDLSRGFDKSGEHGK